MTWSGAKVFITGVDGFVGANLARALLSQGAKVGGLVHRTPRPSRSGLLAWGIAREVATFKGDVAHADQLSAALSKIRPQWIFHLAAQATVSTAQEHASETLHSNVLGTWNLVFLAARQPGLEGVVVASSDKAYGASPDLPYTEETPLRGGGVYDSSKASADLLARTLARRLNLALGVTRCANIYGPGDLNFTRIVPDSVATLCRGERPCIRGSGLHERDFLFIDDAVAAYLALAARLHEPGVGGEAFNFGSGRSIRIVDLVRRIMALDGSFKGEPMILGVETPYEIARQELDSSKARRLLDWSPAVPLEEGLPRTIDWYRRHLSQKETS